MMTRWQLGNWLSVAGLALIATVFALLVGGWGASWTDFGSVLVVASGAILLVIGRLLSLEVEEDL